METTVIIGVISDYTAVLSDDLWFRLSSSGSV